MAREEGGPARFSLATHLAEELRSEGARLVGDGKYELALEKYTEAIVAFGRCGFSTGLAICLTNRAIVCAKLGWWPESYCDAKSATRVSPKYGKAWYRAGVALEQLGAQRAAGVALYKAIEVDGSLYATATPALKRCRLASIAARHSQKLLVHATADVTQVAESSLNDVSGLVVGLGPGRCGLHSLAALLESSAHATARCLSRGTRHLLWSPSEPRSRVIKRRLEELVAADVRADVHYAWLPYVRELLRLAPDAKCVVMRRDEAAVVESWFYWTEAGSARAGPLVSGRDVPRGACVAVHHHAKNHWQWHDQTVFDFDEWDLTLPKVEDAPDKRSAIAAYVRDYYLECETLARDFPENVTFCDCDTLFRSIDAKRRLFRFLGLRDEPSDLEPRLNRQRYLYAEAAVGDDFHVGDFAAPELDDTLEDDDDERLLEPEIRVAQEDAAASSSSETLGPRLGLVVPDGAKPGDTIRASVKGRAFEARVPDGARPGDSFQVPAPAFYTAAAAA
mmetsp:Transcript_3537/g.10930  ORF Transcript_3537/g.10930 Transcript_3537/m.10930 type:complete len:507 (+) Transcript_3537:21-1541(+)